MFTVGEFSQLAQVSKRLLRYYDEIGLLKPDFTDKFTHRRYYRAEQLPQLNRILALKDLGLSLDQIQRLLSHPVSSDEMQGMLLLKKAEIEQHLQGELQRIRNIESRLRFIRDTETGKPLDIVVKHIPAHPVLSVRTTFPSVEAAMIVFGEIVESVPDSSMSGWFFGVWHSDGLDEQGMDMEMGRILTVNTHVPVQLNDGLCLTVRELPAVETMATFIVEGPTENMHLGYSAIGMWADVNGYRFAGSPREIALRLPQIADSSDGITEIQFPVEPGRSH
jgi:DNA-binding transcriptional MerR regulator/effector-binding domain-containing protein